MSRFGAARFGAARFGQINKNVVGNDAVISFVQQNSSLSLDLEKIAVVSLNLTENNNSLSSGLIKISDSNLNLLENINDLDLTLTTHHVSILILVQTDNSLNSFLNRIILSNNIFIKDNNTLSLQPNVLKKSSIFLRGDNQSIQSSSTKINKSIVGLSGLSSIITYSQELGYDVVVDLLSQDSDLNSQLVKISISSCVFKHLNNTLTSILLNSHLSELSLLQDKHDLIGSLLKVGLIEMQFLGSSNAIAVLDIIIIGVPNIFDLFLVLNDIDVINVAEQCDVIKGK